MAPRGARWYDCACAARWNRVAHPTLLLAAHLHP
jgi:hypothetical protein